MLNYLIAQCRGSSLMIVTFGVIAVASLAGRSAICADDAIARWLRGEMGEKSLMHVKNNTTLVQRQVDGVTEYSLTIRRPSDDGGVDRHVRTIVFSSAAGFNPLTYELISFGRREVEMSWEYRKDGGIYLPSRYEIRRYNRANPRDNEPQDADANLVSHRIFKLRESSLNQPVDSEAFELASLGLEYGDRVADEIERQLQVYDGEKLVPAEEFKLDPSRVPERSRKVSSTPSIPQENVTRR
ncbi:MAG: hypothetical protein ACYTG0_22315 [Planctomycetota bacterium]|jgi:hypothetical protein